MAGPVAASLPLPTSPLAAATPAVCSQRPASLPADIPTGSTRRQRCFQQHATSAVGLKGSRNRLHWRRKIRVKCRLSRVLWLLVGETILRWVVCRRAVASACLAARSHVQLMPNALASSSSLCRERAGGSTGNLVGAMAARVQDACSLDQPLNLWICAQSCVTLFIHVSTLLHCLRQKQALALKSATQPACFPPLLAGRGGAAVTPHPLLPASPAGGAASHALRLHSLYVYRNV